MIQELDNLEKQAWKTRAQDTVKEVLIIIEAYLPMFRKQRFFIGIVFRTIQEYQKKIKQTYLCKTESLAILT